ncbi:MAG: type II toxin-antitoxin system PemK/MazF family toxin [Panacagrimonas sp.]
MTRSLAPHVPDRGQIIVIDFDPKAGSEMGKRRPALVMSPKAYNRATGFVLVCPLTTQPRGNPLEVPVVGARTAGAVLVDRVRSFDWRARHAAWVEKAPEGLFEEVSARLLPLIGSASV